MEEETAGSFDEWFRTLTDQLNVKTKLYDYKKAITLEEDSNEIHIGDNFYKPGAIQYCYGKY